jgi:hypothetical protein
VEPTANRVEVKLAHPEVAMPGRTVDVTITLKDPAGKPLSGEVTLWLVDQAVLVGGISCANAQCHGANPSANKQSVLKGANNPTLIASAISSNKGGTMGTAVKFTSAQLADIAAYLANPNVTATAPVVSVSSSTLNFASTTIGQTSATQSVVLSNTGNAALAVSSVTLTGTAASDFSVVSDGCVGSAVSAGSSCTIALVFKPTASGTRSATLQINHNAASASTTVTLFGAVTAVTDTAANLVVEYYHSGLDHYFMSANAAEIAGLDANPALGWLRTGNSFKSGGNTPVCRFYGSVLPGPNSHFFTAIAAECDSLKQLQAATPATQKRWNFESLDFSTTAPGSSCCPTGTTPVYRAYNNGNARGIDSNHRITANLSAIKEVEARGWVNEGIVMCGAG